jgi:hypothetical protein
MMRQIPRKCLKSSLPVVLALALALAGCGGDEEEPTATTETQAETTETATTETETTEIETTSTAQGETVPPPTAEEPTPKEPSDSPEDQPGGAGDEEPARSLALFTGEGGRITPRVIRVPAFISIRVELRSADGRKYGLRFAGETIEAGGALSSAAITLDGLRPGATVTGTPTGAGNRVRIEATAEPGP